MIPNSEQLTAVMLFAGQNDTNAYLFSAVSQDAFFYLFIFVNILRCFISYLQVEESGES